MLVIKDKTVKPEELQSVHPWFKGWPNEIIRSTLKTDIERYQISINVTNEYIQQLTTEKVNVDSLFIQAFASRQEFLFARKKRDNLKVNDIPTKPTEMLVLSGYKKCCANYAIKVFRLYDEIIFALFPHISWEVLQSSSGMTYLGRYLVEDISLMQFLSGEKKMPLDPDTVNSQIIITSEIPKQNQNLYDALLASKVIYPLPEPVRKFEKNQTKKKKSARKKKNNSQKPGVLIPSSLTAVSVAPTATKKKTVKKERVIIPAGGWSTKDKIRSSDAVTKKQTHLIESKSEGAAVQTIFQPATEITLTDSQYDTLQAIRSPTTLEYTLTYDPVVSLLEAIGIIVDRKSGSSHAHIFTPGHNMKILMEPHGWTDAYGHKTMTKLRNLMKNLSLNDNKFIKDRD